MRFGDISQAIGNTPLVGLPRLSLSGHALHLKLEGCNPTGSIEDRVAQALIEDAAAAGRLQPGQRVLAASSGDTGVALAALCRVRGHAFTCVLPDDASDAHRRALAAFGAEVVLAAAGNGPDGPVRTATAMAGADPDMVLLSRDDAAAAQIHHATTAAEIIADLPDVTALVTVLDTGATVTGVGKRLKRWNPDVRVHTAEAGPGEHIPGLRGLDEDSSSAVLDLAVIDERIRIGAADAVAMTRRLALEEGILAGVSTGAALVAALRVCATLDAGSQVVVVSPDAGGRHLATSTA